MNWTMVKSGSVAKAPSFPLLLLLLLLSPLIESANLKIPSSSSFPPDFSFGTASSAYQYEGRSLANERGRDIWDVYTHEPGNIVDGSNADLANDQYHLYEEDADLLASLGVNSQKFSILWARVLPKGRHGNISWDGIRYYKNVIRSLLRKGIQPFVTVNHYDLPQELEDKYGGWLSPELQNEYAYLAEVCFKYLGNGVKHWITFNEPNLWTVLSYRVGSWPPNHCTRPPYCPKGDSLEPLIVAHNMILAHASAVNIYRRKYQKAQGGKIGISVLYYWYEPLRNTSADKLAVERGLSFVSNWFLDPLIYGRYPKEMKEILGSDLPEFSSSDLESLQDAAGLDFIGINHYTTYYIQDCLSSKCDSNDPGNYKVEGFVSTTLSKNGTTIGEETGLYYLLVYPDGMEKVIMYVRDRYPNIPIYVTENGYCDFTDSNSSIEAVLNDTKRVEFLDGYLGSVENALRKGADVRGYFVWSLLDNFEWQFGYTKHLGLYHVDRITMKRTPKLSAKWYKKFITEKHGVTNRNLYKSQ
ncbi:unnamed protein product [Cuscuta europaea]|uniref:Beta-glucosidase n=1 Tax=Cuscuta europaea TaxID=41803 RepID=A0A9P1EN67_CUSEU|nr:unnamed protein product [Cuscuta europaea]